MTRPAAGPTVGLDVGTTRVKAVTFDAAGAVVALAERPTPWRTDRAGSELDATVLADVVRTVVGEAASAVPRVAAVGVTGMGESGVLTGPDGVPLAPVRAWHDERADVEPVRSEIGATAFERAVGMALDAQPSLPKILRLRSDHPRSRAATRFWSVPEWAVACLGGTPGSELSLASRTGLLDVTTGRAWPQAADLLGADLLGEPQLAGTPQGHAGGPGLPPALDGAVLAVGGHDHQVAALAAGAARHGTLFDSLGTAEALLQFTAGPMTADVVGALVATPLVATPPVDGARGGERLRITAGLTVVRGHYCVMAGLRTGMGLERVLSALGRTTRSDRAELAAAALAVLADPAALAPALAAVQVRATDDEVHLTLSHTAGPAEIWAATVTALAAASGPSVDRMRAAAGARTAVLAAGGWFRDAAVLAAKRRQFPGLEVTAVTEAGAAGAAYLAGVAAGLFPDATTLDGAPWDATAPTPIAPVREVD